MGEHAGRLPSQASQGVPPLQLSGPSSLPPGVPACPAGCVPPSSLRTRGRRRGRWLEGQRPGAAAPPRPADAWTGWQSAAAACRRCSARPSGRLWGGGGEAAAPQHSCSGMPRAHRQRLRQRTPACGQRRCCRPAAHPQPRAPPPAVPSHAWLPSAAACRTPPQGHQARQARPAAPPTGPAPSPAVWGRQGAGQTGQEVATERW